MYATQTRVREVERYRYRLLLQESGVRYGRPLQAFQWMNQELMTVRRAEENLLKETYRGT